ncbi:hypothetical protein Acr_00g0096620 [Actinidia rufa]|uniref:Uncharacterized protein n=1 Tax=Actinidia rufa TaxID=165716 RepID=A0A7J0E134_9ERIC|nr:hypothetical protein Acr_00g0096620 [Actinidia rufa]
MGAVRGNIAMQVTFYPLMCPGIAADRCLSTELRRTDPAELAIERQPSSGACTISARASKCGLSKVPRPCSLPRQCHHRKYLEWKVWRWKYFLSVDEGSMESLGVCLDGEGSMAMESLTRSLSHGDGKGCMEPLT